MNRYRKRPCIVRAWQWDGGLNAVAELDRILGLNWGRADAHDVAWQHYDAEEVVVWNHLERCWIPLPVGHWLVQGVEGEYYPVSPEVFDMTYEALDDA